MRFRSHLPHVCVIALVAIGLVVLGPVSASAQNAPMKDKFRAVTPDGVRLIGDFYPPGGKNGVDSPCVILLHGKGGSRADWGELPEKLQKEGYAVLNADFRGHGESTELDVGKEVVYWTLNPSRRVDLRRIQPNQIPTKIDKAEAEFKDYQNLLRYAGHDLLTMKLWVNEAQNRKLCNSSNVILIGADQGALLGLLWLYGEQHRPLRAMQNPDPRAAARQAWINPPESQAKDITCTVYLSMTPNLGTANLSGLARDALKSLRDSKLRTLVLYGGTDTASARYWGPKQQGAFDILKPPNQEALYKHNNFAEVKTNLVGTKLLGQAALNTEDFIIGYLKKSVPEMQANVMKDKDVRLDTVWTESPPSPTLITAFPAYFNLNSILRQ